MFATRCTNLAVALAMVAAAFVGCLATGCSEQSEAEATAVRTSAIDSILADFKSSDAQVREGARNRLSALAAAGLSIADARQLLIAATQAWPSGDAEALFDVGPLLVHVAIGPNEDELWRLAIRLFGKFDAETREQFVFDLAAELDPPSAAEYFRQLTDRYAAKDMITATMLTNFDTSDELQRLIVPELLKHDASDDSRYEFEGFALSGLEQKAISAEDLAPYLRSLVASYQEKRQRQKQLEQPSGTDWIWQSDYRKLREHVAQLLDLMGYVGPAEVLASLTESLDSRDPMIQYHAAISLLRHRQEVPPPVFKSIAASAEMREPLYRILETSQLLDLYPEEHRELPELAESCLVNWLIDTTESESPPAEIELMAKFERPAPPPTDDAGLPAFGQLARTEVIYLFRFRSSADSPWLAGIAGPFELDSEELSFDDLTYSKFKKWDKQSPREHYEELIRVDEVLDAEGEESDMLQPGTESAAPATSEEGAARPESAAP